MTVPTDEQIDKVIRLLPIYNEGLIPKENILEILGYIDLIEGNKE
jgi:hypothetical protein